MIDHGIQIQYSSPGREGRHQGTRLGLDRKSFFEGRFAQILIEADEFKAPGRFLAPYEGCRKLQGVRSPQGMN